MLSSERMRMGNRILRLNAESRYGSQSAIRIFAARPNPRWWHGSAMEKAYILERVSALGRIT